MLDSVAWDVKTLRDFPTVPEPEEIETTFEGNALLKARYYGTQFGVACLADDSGIEVDALDGTPGVYSARYAGENCSYDDNNRTLLAALKSVPPGKRRARFVCCAAFVDRDGIEHVEIGTVEGVIAPEPRGSNGFGYDPHFLLPDLGMTAAEISAEQKNLISHRGKALRRLMARLKEGR